MSDIFDDIPVVENGEVISSAEAEIIQNFPDSSEDVDIELKYKRFVDYFLVCGNKAKSAKLAGFNASSADSLKAQACKAFKRAEVQEYYKLRKDELAKKSEISFEAYMSELVSIATFDIKDVVETEVVLSQEQSFTGEAVYSVHFKNIEDIPVFARKAVKAIEIAKDGTPKMIFYDKLAALKMIGEIKGFMSAQSGDDEDDGGIAMIPSVLHIADDEVTPREHEVRLEGGTFAKTHGEASALYGAKPEPNVLTAESMQVSV